MKELASRIDLQSRISRRKFLGGTAGVALVALLGPGCGTDHKEPGKSSDQISEEEKLFPIHPIADLQNPEARSNLECQFVRTSGYLSMVDQDLVFYTIANVRTTSSDKNVHHEIEDLTYVIREDVDDDSSTLYAIKRNRWDLWKSFNKQERKTKKPDPKQQFIITGQIMHGEVEIGDSSEDKINTTYLKVQGIYRI